MTVYRIFDIAVACDFPLPGLIELETETPDWQVTRGSGTPGGKDWNWFHSWESPGGTEIMACARRDKAYILKINGLAFFVIDLEQQNITVFPIADCPQSTLAHLLLDQVIPRILCHQGRMVVHASAVVLPNGKAVAFAGPSGQGKSTLATAFFQAGHALVTDDCLLLENKGGVVQALASYPSLRLWPDSAEAMVDESKLEGARFSDMAHYTNKKQLLLNEMTGSPDPRWIELEALFILEKNEESPAKPSIEVRPAGGLASIMTLIESLFALDVVSEESVRRGFETVRQVASGVPVTRFAYPRDYARLPDVIGSIIGETGGSD